MRTNRLTLFSFLLLLLLPLTIQAQEYDLLIDNGHVMDPKNGIDQVMDVAIADGVIVRVSESIPSSSARRVVDANGLYVTPGLVDIHGHHFYGTEEDPVAYAGGFWAIPPDGFTLRSGVTTVVDLGGAGWKRFPLFKENVIDRSTTRVLSFINIVGAGMQKEEVEQNLNDMDAKMTALRARQFPDLIVGVKLAHFQGHDWEPVHRVVEAGEMADLPVMIDFGQADTPLSLETLLMGKLRPGDMFTHLYADTRGREPIIDENGQLKPYMREARERGILFDVGHGGGSFVWHQMVPAMEQGFWPDFIGTDLHRSSMNGGMKDMTNLISKFLNTGMPLYDAIDRASWRPAQAIGRQDLGHLSEGAGADLAIFRLREGEFGYMDSRRRALHGNLRLQNELTLRDGQVVWDLNAIASPVWERE